METKDLSKFVALVVAKLTGDKATATAIRNEKLAKGAFKQQINATESDITKKEVKVERAEEKLEEAIYQATDITDEDSYIRNIVSAQKTLDTEKAELDAMKEDLAYFTKLLTEKF